MRQPFDSVIKQMKRDDLRPYRAIPFWSWNGQLEPDELIRQIHWMNQNGMGGFFIHARSGLKTEYMSDAWMHCVEVCAQEAEKLGMDAWIYDENGWPSGFAGGKLLACEEDRDQYILSKTGAFDPNATVSYLLTENALIRTSEACAAGEYLNLYIQTASSTADILNPEVVSKFLALTHDKYQERFGTRFREKIRGFFTDEPQYQRWHTPYTRMIAKAFREQYNEDVLDRLGLLFVEKAGYRGFRYRYWKTMQELMLHGFAEKVFTWCEENKVLLTGHYVEESSLGNQLMCCGGCMPFYAYLHIPGIDWLGKDTDNELPARQLNSVAQQLGKKHVLTETFGCCGWEVTPAELRRIAGFQYACGVNLMCQHLVPYQEYGSRKHDYPAHYSPVNPWVRDGFKDFNDYFTSLGWLLANSKETVNVAVLHPMRSAYFDYKRELESEGFGIAVLDQQLRKDCRVLSGANIAYHFLDETLLAKYGFTERGRIGCGRCRYDYLVLPHLLTMDQTTEALLRDYVHQGGKVLLLGGKPEFLEGEPFDYPYLENNCTWEELIAAQPYGVENDNTQIYSTYRMIDGVPFLFVQNAAADAGQKQTFRFRENIGSFLKWDPVTDSRERVGLTLELEAGESMLLFPEQQPAPERQKKEEYLLKFSDAQVRFPENQMVIDCVRVSKDGVHFSAPKPCMAVFQQLLEARYRGSLYLKYEFQVRELPSQLLLRAERCGNEKASINGIPLAPVPESGIEENVVAYDISPYTHIGINSYELEMQWYENEKVYNALFGENVTESLKNCITYDSELEPIYLAGILGVYAEHIRKSDTPGFVIADRFYIGKPPERISEPVLDGLACICGEMTLTQKVTLQHSNVILVVAGTYLTAEVFVNGQSAGKLLFDRKLDISSVAKVGENEISVRFIMSNRNLLGPHHYKGDKNEGVSPWTFELAGSWIDGKNPFYHDGYDLKLLY